MQGTYKYTYLLQANPTRRYAHQTMRVDVLDQTKNKYQVRYHTWRVGGGPMDAPGTTHWVQKKSVAIDPAPPVVPDNIRLPYKD